MTKKFSFVWFVLAMLAVLFCAQITEAQTSISAQYGPIPVLGTNWGSVGTNSIGGVKATTLSFPAYFTNTYTTVSAGLTNTNTVTNLITGIIDVSKEPGFCVQMIFGSTSATNSTNTAIFQFIPGLDGANWDTANAAFYVTNVFNGTNQVSLTTNFPDSSSKQIGFYYLTNIIVSGSAILTNPTVQVSGKRVLSY